MKSNILFICQNRDRQKKLGKDLADELGMFYADLNDIMEYNFIDKKTLQFLGKEYYEEQVYKAIKAASNYENSLMVATFDSLNIKDGWEQIKKTCIIIYLRESFEPFDDVDTENKVNELVYEDRDVFFQEKSDIVVNNLINQNDCLPEIFKEMKKYYNLS